MSFNRVMAVWYLCLLVHVAIMQLDLNILLMQLRLGPVKITKRNLKLDLEIVYQMFSLY